MTSRTRSLRKRRPDAVRRTLDGDEQRPGPRQPNEHDESADSQALDSDLARARIRQAYSDLERGLQDTDCRNRVAEVLKTARSRKPTKP